MPRATLIRPLAIGAFLLCLWVVVLGAYVRLSAAGLSCPDWPGCYGHVTPSGSPTGGPTAELGKAWKEMVHRYSAATLGLLILVIAALAVQYRRQGIVAPGYAIGLLVLVITQGIFGMLTVTRQLDPAIVTAHLLFGLSTLSLLWWLVLTIGRRQANAWRGSTAFLGSGLSRTRTLAWLALAMLAVQLALGGWTSSHYAATACPDFPTCRGSGGRRCTERSESISRTASAPCAPRYCCSWSRPGCCVREAIGLRAGRPWRCSSPWPCSC